MLIINQLSLDLMQLIQDLLGICFACSVHDSTSGWVGFLFASFLVSLNSACLCIKVLVYLIMEISAALIAGTILLVLDRWARSLEA